MVRSPRGGTIEPETKNGRASAIGMAALVIAALTILRLLKGAGDPPYGIDASYYYQLARHVLRGEGLITTVSLYHEGWVVPARTPIYPLWPLLLGFSGRVLGLARAADLLPRIFYVIDIVMLYVLARAVAVRLQGERISERAWVPDTATWIVAIFGLALTFFSATTHPYTEGLAFGMAFATLLLLERCERTQGFGAAAASGMFGALAFLARTQMIGISIGCAVAFLWFLVRTRAVPGLGRRIALAATWAIAALVTITPWLFFIGFVPGLTENRMPRVVLPPFAGWTELPSRTEWLRQRASSLGIMFDPTNAYSYVQSFGIAAYLVPIAAILWIATLAVRRGAKAEGDRTPGLLVPAVLVAGVFFFFNLMLYHSEVWMPWLFGWRHGLPFLFLLMVAVPWLVARSGAFAPFLGLLLLVSVLMSARNIAAFVRSPDPELSVAETGLVKWMNAQPRPVSAMVTNAQILGSMTDARLYWTFCDASGASTRAMLHSMPIQYVILYEHEARCRFAAEGGRMRLVAVFGPPGRRIFLLEPLER